MKKIIYIAITLFFFWIFVSEWYWYKDPRCYQYWINAIDNFDWTCSCKAWYFLWKNENWILLCMTKENCKDIHGKNAVTNADWSCACISWYMMYNDYFWNKYCVEWKSLCKSEYGTNSIYNSTTNSCSCREWTELTTTNYWSTYECKSCTNKYWPNATYNSTFKICECKDWYTLNNWKCQKTEIKKYFHLLEYDYWYKVKVLEYDTWNAYELTVVNVTRLYNEIQDFIWKMVTINFRANGELDKWDVLFLDNATTITGVSTTITDIKEIPYKFTDGKCQRVYGKYSMLWDNNECICKSWYAFSVGKTECVWQSIKKIEPPINTWSSTNSIFDTRWIK